MPDAHLRIVIVAVSRLVGEMLQDALARAGFTTVEILRDLADFRRVVSAADFVIVGLEGEGLPEDCRSYLADRAPVKVLGIEETKGRAFLYELSPSRTLGAASPDEVAAAIQQTARGS
jgi:5,10-methylene-tetrahydrofolate dehydrogenase/methenyl tetrahydrofolate cyclohydrolase